MVTTETFTSLHTFLRADKSRSRLRAAAWKVYLQRDDVFSVGWPLLVQGYSYSLLPGPGKGPGGPADMLPERQTEPQDIASHMTYRKGSEPDLSMICMSVFFFLTYNVVTEENRSGDISPSGCTVLLFLLCGLPLQSPLAKHRGSLVWECRHNAVSLSPSLFFSLVLLNTKRCWEGGLCSTLVACCPHPQITHVIQMSLEGEKGGWDIKILCTPRPPQSITGPPGTDSNRKVTER